MATRLLLVVSQDYGELSNARYLLTGCGFDAALLLPERLRTAGDSGVPARAYGYRSLADVADALACERPDVVFLLSAYLFALNGLLGSEDVRPLLDHVR